MPRGFVDARERLTGGHPRMAAALVHCAYYDAMD